MEGTLTVQPFNPRQVLARLHHPGFQTTDPKALTLAGLNATFQGSLQRIRLQPIALQLDDTEVQGWLQIENFLAPVVRFALTGNSLDLDRYAPSPELRRKLPPASPAMVFAAAAESLPLTALRQVATEGQLQFGSLRAGGLLLNDLQLQMKGKNGLIQFHPFQGRFYQGTYGGNITLAGAPGTSPRISAEERLSGVQLGPLLVDLSGHPGVTGSTDLYLKASAQAGTPDELRRTLNGQLDIQVREGTLQGFDILRILQEAKSRLKGRPLPPAEEPLETEFSELSGSVRVENGLARNEDLKALSPQLRVEGRGTANLPQEQLDYNLIVTLTDHPEVQKEFRELIGIPIALNITGTFREPRIQPALVTMLKLQAERAIERHLRKLGEKFQKKVEEGAENGEGGMLREILKGILQQDVPQE
jgi:AsmA protein